MALETILRAPRDTGYYVAPELDLAVADQVARLARVEQEAILADLTKDNHRLLLHDFNFWGRPTQLMAMECEAHIIAMLSGRGSGKTRTLSEWVHKKAMDHPGCRIALVARTVADVRDTMINGESGILNICPDEEKPDYVPSNRTVTWPNGSIAQTFSAEKPAQLRGPQFHYAAVDELAAWPVKPIAGDVVTMWDNVKIATRLGDKPQIFVATTPRRVPAIIKLINDCHENPEKVFIVRGSTRANRHLSQVYRDTVVGMYEGTSLAQQELEGEILGDMKGALLTSDIINTYRHREDLFNIGGDYCQATELPIRFVGVDPSVAEKPKDECGIVVVGSDGHPQPHKRHMYVLEDASLLGSPNKWAKKAIEMAKKYSCPIVAESNQGAELVRMTIKAIDDSIPVILAHSSKSKQVRAEPIVLAYEQGRVHHDQIMPMLEDQLTTWIPGESNYSPDRLDALVIAGNAILVHKPKGFGRVQPMTPANGEPPIHRRVLALGPAQGDAYRAPDLYSLN